MMSLASTACADPEREHLARLAHEIELLTPLIDAAEASADQSARIKFRYDRLRHELEIIRMGILEQVYSAPPAPRRIRPLSGDYRR
ncbi:MAG TPA: conjugal transfer protein [Rhodobacteraceae bacterium]|nr:conjugal transfer protein [Paracoccaceae bacterium]